MTYYESSTHIKITKERAILELKRHGCSDVDLFLSEMGDTEEYSAKKVLEWLGY